MFLHDVINRTNVCSLILPTTHVIASPCNPVYALNPEQQTLFIQGKPKDTYLSCCAFQHSRRKELMRESFPEDYDFHKV